MIEIQGDIDRSSVNSDKNNRDVVVELSEYEILRLQNIKKNEEYIKNLGIPQNRSVVVKAEIRSSKRTKHHKESNVKAEDFVYRRSSRRLRGDNTEIIDRVDSNPIKKVKQERNLVDGDFNFHFSDDENVQRIRITAEGLRSFIETTNSEHNESISNEVGFIYENGFINFIILLD